jgi:hypothetical protein
MPKKAGSADAAVLARALARLPAVAPHRGEDHDAEVPGDGGMGGDRQDSAGGGTGRAATRRTLPRMASILGGWKWT